MNNIQNSQMFLVMLLFYNLSIYLPDNYRLLTISKIVQPLTLALQ